LYGTLGCNGSSNADWKWVIMKIKKCLMCA
jgi:hypothetical protein